MNTNKLIIAAAGAGKTTFLVNEALKQKDGNVLITTYTQANEEEIRKKIIEINKCIPENIAVQTWFSFLLQHGVRPYQGCLFEKKVKGMILVNKQSAVRYYNRSGIPVCYKEDENLEKHYFTDTFKIYSDKLSKFVFRCCY
jgi:superfamily I DNA/RNA helicase